MTLLLSDVVTIPLTESEAIILREIIDRGRVHLFKLVDALYGHKEDGGPYHPKKVIGLHIESIRRKLKPNFILDNVPNFGFMLMTSDEVRRNEKYAHSIGCCRYHSRNGFRRGVLA